MPEIIIIGEGAHAKVVLEAIQMQAIYTVKGCCVDNIAVGEKVLDGILVMADAMLTSIKGDESVYFIVAIGDNSAREKIFKNACKKFIPATIIHPKACVSSSAMIGEGTVILSNACINSFVSVGENSIVNIGVLIDHDSKIGANTHISVGTIVGNNVTLDGNTMTTMGQIINSFSKGIKK
jgi:acetyltransferase EpsM